MAKFRKIKRYARRSFGAVKRYGRSDKLGPLEVAIGSAGYGFARPYVANMIPDIPQLGPYSDNVVLGGVGALAAWKGKGIVKKVGMIVLANEAFVAGSRMSTATSTSNATNKDAYNY